MEVIYAAANHARFVNRGFLIGPLCPIYGFGVLSVLWMLAPVKDSLILLYLGSVIICSVIEFIVGWASEKFMHVRLWDYSDNALNIGGYVCLSFSLLWGIGCMCVVYIVHPRIERLVDFICSVPGNAGNIVVCILCVVFVTDLIITCMNAAKLDARMKAIADISKALEAVSYGVGGELADGTLKVKAKREELGEKIAVIDERKEEKLAEMAELREKLSAELSTHNFVHSHLVNAFPHLQKTRYKEQIEKIRRYRLGK